MCDQYKFKLLKQVGLQRPYRIVDISPKNFNLDQILRNFEFNKTKNQNKFNFRKPLPNPKETINLSQMKRKIINQFNKQRMNRSVSRKHQQNNIEEMSPFFRICHYSGPTEPSSPSASRITPKCQAYSVERSFEKKKSIQYPYVQRKSTFSEFEISAWTRKSSENV